MAIQPHPALPAGAAAAISTLLAGFRTSTCVIERPATGVDAGGAPLSGWETAATVDCQVIPAGRAAIERVFGGRFGPEMDYVVKLPPDVSVQSDYRIQVNGKTLQVIADDDAKSFGFELLVATKATAP